jgi:glycine/D-amino acid oxidase-like deaminating enzyme
MAPDGDFILGRMPGDDRVIVASPCSGHGFKFAPVIGEIIADLVTRGATAHDISRFAIGRSTSSAACGAQSGATRAQSRSAASKPTVKRPNVFP